MAKQEHAPWTRDQLLVLLRLYLQLPFGRLHRLNPEIIALAEKIGRSANAVAMKASNFAYLDPTCDRKGLSSASTADRALWDEFVQNSEQVAVEAEEAYARLEAGSATPALMPFEIPTGDTEVSRTVRTRRVQSFFRMAVLTSYNSTCAISGLALPELLIASHIIPWSENVARRADPTNGLCLNALFDRAFDCGLISFDSELRVLVSERLKNDALSAELKCSLDTLAGRPLRLPSRFHPDTAALEHHRERIFQG